MLFFPFLFRKNQDSPFQDLFYIVHVKAVTDAGYFLLPSVNHVPLLLTSAQAPRVGAQPSHSDSRLSKPSSWGHVPLSTLIHKGTKGCLDNRRNGPQGCQGRGNMSRKEKAASSQKQHVPRRRPRTLLPKAFKPISSPLPSYTTSCIRRTKTWPLVSSPACRYQGAAPSLLMHSWCWYCLDESPNPGRGENTHFPFSLLLRSFYTFQLQQVVRAGPESPSVPRAERQPGSIELPSGRVRLPGSSRHILGASASNTHKILIFFSVQPYH